jgi:hypothetical protein
MQIYHAYILDWRRCESLLHQRNAYYVGGPCGFPLEFFCGL